MGTLTEARCPRCGVVGTMVPIVFGFPSPQTFEVPETCASCGRELDGDPEDDPTDAGGPICGECNRARNFDADEEASWLTE